MSPCAGRHRSSPRQRLSETLRPFRSDRSGSERVRSVSSDRRSLHGLRSGRSQLSLATEAKKAKYESTCTSDWPLAGSGLGFAPVTAAACESPEPLHFARWTVRIGLKAR